MADGKNEARAFRVIEVANDFRTLQSHISSLISRPQATLSDPASAQLPGYALVQRLKAEAQPILAWKSDNASLGLDLQAGSPPTEEEKNKLQRILLKVSSYRFQVHKLYLKTSAGLRWITTRQQILQGRSNPESRDAEPLRAIDQRLQQELNAITDQRVISELRSADSRKGFWIDEDPSLQQILTWIRFQRD